MIIYKDTEANKYYSLLHKQNPAHNALPLSESTLWFLPLRLRTRGKAVIGFEAVPGAWPQPLPQTLAGRLVEYNGTAQEAAFATADPGPTIPNRREEDEL